MGYARRLAAVIPYRFRNGRLEVAVITSASNGDWILPKGGIEDGEQPWEAALREAKEEAGLLGDVKLAPLGRCASNGNGEDTRVYALCVSRVLERWPEDEIRERRWMSLPDAVSSLRPTFRPFVSALARELGVAAPRMRDADA